MVHPYAPPSVSQHTKKGSIKKLLPRPTAKQVPLFAKAKATNKGSIKTAVKVVAAELDKAKATNKGSIKTAPLPNPTPPPSVSQHTKKGSIKKLLPRRTAKQVPRFAKAKATTAWD